MDEISGFVYAIELIFLLAHIVRALSVYGLVLLETAQTVMVTNDAFQWFVYGFGNMIELSKPTTSSVDAPMMDGLVAFIVQVFFSWRIWVSSFINEGISNYLPEH